MNDKVNSHISDFCGRSHLNILGLFSCMRGMRVEHMRKTVMETCMFHS